jgi:PilZ domain-containing protein
MRQNGRFGNRAAIRQPAILQLDGRVIDGTIENVGLGGAFFTASELPAAGTRATLRRLGGRAVPVRVMWQRRGGQSGVGLMFAEPPRP